MTTAVFVAPFLRENTLRWIRALADLEGTRAAVITQDPPEHVPADLRTKLAGLRRVEDCMNGAQLADACRALAVELGPVHRLLGVLEQLQVPLAEARDAVGIPGLTGEVARNFRDKARMKEVLAAAGLPVARQKRVTSEADLRAFIVQVGYPVVVKPPEGVGAQGTYRLTDAEALEQAIVALKPSPERVLQAEEFIVGEENTLEAVTIQGEPVWFSGTRYLPGPLTVLENPWIQYCVLLPREEHDPEFGAFARTSFAAVRALGLSTGLTHMEWFRRPDGSHVVSEVGARPPGVHIVPMMSAAHGFDMVRAWVRLMVHEQFTAPPRTHAAGTAFLRGQGPGARVTAVTGAAEALAAVGPMVVEARLPRVGQPRASGYEGEGYVILRHPTTKAVADGLKTLVSTLRVELG